MRWLKLKLKFVVLMLTVGSCLVLAQPMHIDAAQTSTKSVARVGFYETGQTPTQDSTQTNTTHQARLPQTGMVSGWFSPTLGFILLISSLSLINLRRRNSSNEKNYD